MHSGSQTGPDIHTLTFDSLGAVLDPVTGMGTLILPCPAHNPELLLLYLSGDDAASIAPWWLGEKLGAYSSTMTVLGSIGWELPENNEGRPAWFEAGRTPCCDRMTISLVGQDVEGVDLPIQVLLHVVDQLQQATADACPCHQEASQPVPSR